MNLESRIEKLETRQRVIEVENEPRYMQRCDRDEDGNVIACERLVFQRNPPGSDTLGPVTAAFEAMVREPFSRSTCCYSECEHRADCRADGALTKWGTS